MRPFRDRKTTMSLSVTNYQLHYDKLPVTLRQTLLGDLALEVHGELHFHDTAKFFCRKVWKYEKLVVTLQPTEKKKLWYQLQTLFTTSYSNT